MKAKLIFSSLTSSLTMTNADTMGGVIYRHSVNAGTDLQFGCAAMAEVTFSFRTANFPDNVVFEGQTFTLQFSQTEDGTDAYETYGIFNVATVTKQGGKTSVKAYDNMYKFERGAESYLLAVTYPVTVKKFLIDLCTYCGVELSDYPTTNMLISLASPIPVNGGTCRNLLADVAELTAGFAYFGTDGKLRISWYRNNTMSLDNTKYTSWTRAEYATAPVTGVFIQSTGNPVDIGTEGNRYVVNSNPIFNLLVATDSLNEGSNTATTAAQAIYNAVSGVSYVPMEVHMFKDFGIVAGDIINVNGVTTYVMEKVMKPSGVTLVSTGNKIRDVSVADTRQRQVSEMYGIRQEFRAENNNLLSKIEAQDGRFSLIEQDIDSITQEISGFIKAPLGQYESVPNTDGVSNMYGFELTSDGYYTSQNHGVHSSFAYGKWSVNNTGTENKDLVFSCINYGENNYDYAIISNVDTELQKNNNADTTGVFYSFKGKNSNEPVNVSIPIPPGQHYVTFKYRKDGSTNAEPDYFKIRENIDSYLTTTQAASLISQSIDDFGASLSLKVTNGEETNTIALTKDGIQLGSSQTISFTGFVKFTDLSTSGATTINGGNITANSITADKLNVDAITTRLVKFAAGAYGDQTIVSSNLSGAELTVDVGLADSIIGNSTANLILHGTQIYMARTGYDIDSNYAVKFDLMNRSVVPSIGGIWDIGTRNYPLNTIYTDFLNLTNDSIYFDADYYEYPPYLKWVSGSHSLRMYYSENDDGNYDYITIAKW